MIPTGAGQEPRSHGHDGATIASPGTLVHVIGASGRSGGALAAALGPRVVPVVRDPAKWQRLGFDVPPRAADLTDPRGLAEALRDATQIVCCAHARHAAAVIAAAPAAARLVFLGSTRKFTRWPDEHGDGVLRGEAALLASGRSGVMLHPTMIYGASGEDNVRRLARLMRRAPVLPLPAGGRSLVQPIHQSDVTRAILAALKRDWRTPQAVVIAGPAPVTYVDFMRAIAAACGMRPPRVIQLPGWLLVRAAVLTRLLPGLPAIGAAEIRRLLEDKAFDIAPMREVLGVSPIGLAEGLALTFPRGL